MSFICTQSNELVSGDKKVLVPILLRRVRYLGINRRFLKNYDENLMPKENAYIESNQSFNPDNFSMDDIEPQEKESFGYETVKEVPVSQKNLAAFLENPKYETQFVANEKTVRFIFDVPRRFD